MYLNRHNRELFPVQHQIKPINVLFVCTGNICRSPMAQGIFTQLAEQYQLSELIIADSAGTHAFNGEAPALRAKQVMLDHGIEISHFRARRVNMSDFENFDYLLIMDHKNYNALLAMCPYKFKSKIKYLLSFAPNLEALEIDDPFFKSKYDFERTLDSLIIAISGFLEYLQDTLLTPPGLQL